MPSPELSQSEIFDPEQELTGLLAKKDALAEATHDEEARAARIADRQQNLRLYKERLFGQREAMARLALELEQQIVNDPDASYEELNQVLTEGAPTTHLTPKQVAIFQEKLRRYVDTHQSISETLKTYQEQFPPSTADQPSHESWKRELFRAMFGIYPLGPVDLRIEPMFLYWVTHKAEDYRATYAATLEKQLGIPRESPTIKERVQERNAAGAYVITEPILPGLRARVGVLGKTGPLAAVELMIADRYIQAHEGRHAIDFGLDPDDHLQKLQELTDRLSPETNREELEQLIPELMDRALEVGLRYGRSEILAFFEPADLFFNDWRGLRDFVLAQPIAALVMVAIVANNPRRATLLEKVPGIEVEVLKGFFSAKQQKQFSGKFFQIIQELGQAMPHYDYGHFFSDLIRQTIKEKTGQDLTETIEDEFGIRETRFRRQLLEGMVAAEVLGRHSQLSLKELMWLLENEPLDHWKKLAERAGDDVRDDYHHTLKAALKHHSFASRGNSR